VDDVSASSSSNQFNAAMFISVNDFGDDDDED